MLVYKYVVPERIDIIENRWIRFTQAAALNDPFETYPCFNLFRESLKERSHRFLKGVEGRFDTLSVVAQSLMIPKKVQDEVRKLQQDLSIEYPMLSLTKKRNNLLMWSHYANAHRGFVIGFDSDDPFFHKEKPRKMTPLSEVKYSNKRPIVPPFDECKPEDIYETVLLIKSGHWAYEEEFRMFAQPQAADFVISGKDGFDIYLYKFPPECMREIIFGHLMNPSVKKKIIELIGRQYTHVELFEAKLNETDFDLDIVPYRKCS